MKPHLIPMQQCIADCLSAQPDQINVKAKTNDGIGAIGGGEGIAVHAVALLEETPMKLYDSLTGEKRDFVPHDDTVKMYVCGVTPYSSSHVGHAMCAVYFDTLRRYLEYSGYDGQARPELHGH